MARDLTNQVIIITGGSAGIGFAVAEACAKAGMDIVLNGRDAEKLEDAAEQIRMAGRQVATVVGDVSEPNISDRLLNTAMEQFGKFDVVLANAGYGFLMPAHQIDAQALRDIFDVNFFAAWDLLKTAANRLIEAKRRGHLMMTSSTLSHFSMPDYAAYSSTKAAQHHICQALRLDLAQYGIDVSSIHPTGTATEFADRAAQLRAELGGPQLHRATPDWLVQTPEHVARCIVKCIRKPKPEVWPSLPAKLFAIAATICPRLLNRLNK